MVGKRIASGGDAGSVKQNKKLRVQKEVPVNAATPNKSIKVSNGKKAVNQQHKPTSKKTVREQKEEEVEEEEEDNEEEIDETENVEENDEPTNKGAQSTTAAKGEEKALETNFNSLPLTDRTQKAITKMGFTTMTEIQAKAIPHLLSGRDLIGAARTGSGKTLAFLIPAVEMLSRAQFKHHNGTGVIVLTPTRELAIQIYGVLNELMDFQTQTHGILMGGTSRAAEKEKLDKGVNILVCTPGRLLDHLANTDTFMYKHLRCLIIDEADRILQVGFEQDLRKILELLPTERQTMLFSATQDAKVVEIAKLCFKKTKPVYVGVDDQREIATVETLEQGYIVCPSERRFTLLYTFLKKNSSKKIIVFMSTCDAVQYYADLLEYFKLNLQIWSLHGNLKQQKRTNTFFEFINADRGVLISTDVAARGLHIPAVDWIVQYDPPDDPREYIHRVGRTARAGAQGRALMFLLPTETNFLKYLANAKVPLNEFEFVESKLVTNIQVLIEDEVGKNYHLLTSARKAYRAYLLSYATHALKDTYDVFTLDLLAVAKSFGFTEVPKIDLQLVTDRASGNKNENKKKTRKNIKE